MDNRKEKATAISAETKSIGTWLPTKKQTEKETEVEAKSKEKRKGSNDKGQ